MSDSAAAPGGSPADSPSDLTNAGSGAAGAGYDGRTAVGSPPQTRDLGGVVMTKVAVGPLDNNAYLFVAATGETLLVDAAAQAQDLLALLPAGRLDAVLTTHAHRDHWGALAEVVAATGARTLAGRDDASAIAVPTDRLLDDGDTVRVGDAQLQVIALRGHTPGSVALALADADGAWHVFTGDSLFPGGVGRTTPDTFEQLLDDVTSRVFDRFDDATWIYPGHGWDSTLGAERPHLAEWRERGW